MLERPTIRRAALAVTACAALTLPLLGTGSANAVESNTGQRDPYFRPLALNDQVYQVAPLPGGKFLIGGSFTDGGGNSATDYLARVNADGTRDTSFTPLTLNDEVYAVIPVESGKYLVAGAFTDVGGNTAIDHLVKVNSNGSRDISFTPLALPDSTDTVYWLDLSSSGKYVLGGPFEDAGNNANSDYLVRVNVNGSRDTSFNPPVLDNWVNVVKQVSGGKYLVGGGFKDVGGNPQTDFVARFNSNGTRDATFKPLALNDPVWSVDELANGKYLIGGGFTDAGGNAATDSIARLNASGSRDATFTPARLNGPVFVGIEVTGGKYVVGGGFVNAGGNPQTDHVARLNSNGTRDRTFVPASLNEDVFDLWEVAKGKYLLSGAFTDAGGDARTDSLVRLGFNPGLTPRLGPVAATKTGFTFSIVNFNAAFTWSGKGTNGATVTISKAGKVTVKGLTTGKRSRVTITSIRTGYVAGTNAVTGQAQ